MNTNPIPAKFDAVSEGIHSIQDFLNDQKEKISECVSIFKEGITGAFNMTSSCVSSVLLPINNFIKDMTQMEEEFRQEHLRNEEHYICLQGQMISRSEVITMPMEENY